MSITQVFPRKSKKDYLAAEGQDIGFSCFIKLKREQAHLLFKDNRTSFSLMFGPNPHFYFISGSGRRMHGWCVEFENTVYWVFTGKEKGSLYETAEPDLERDLRFFHEIIKMYK